MEMGSPRLTIITIISLLSFALFLAYILNFTDVDSLSNTNKAGITIINGIFMMLIGIEGIFIFINFNSWWSKRFEYESVFRQKIILIEGYFIGGILTFISANFALYGFTLIGGGIDYLI